MPAESLPLPDVLGWAAVAGSAIGLTALMTGRASPLAAVAWMYTVAAVCLYVKVSGDGKPGEAAGMVCTLGGILALVVFLDRLDTQHRAATARPAPVEPGPADCVGGAALDDVPEGPAWADHLTHTPGADEESPRLRVRRKTRGGPE